MKNTRNTIGRIVLCLLAATLLEAAWTLKRITNNVGASLYPAVAVSGANVYVAWQDKTPGNFEIYFRRSSDGGSTWKIEKRLTNSAGHSYFPAMAVSGANIYVAWQDDTPGNNEIYFCRSTDNGVTWQSQKRITNTAGESGFPALAVSGAKVYVVWNDDTPGNPEIYFRRSLDSGATWKTAKRLTNNTGQSGDADIAVSGANVYVAWQDDRPGNSEAYCRRSLDGGATWQPGKRLSNTSGESCLISLAVNGSDLYLSGTDDSEGNNEIYFLHSADSGATWEEAQRLTNNAGDSFLPKVAVNGTNVCLAWTDDVTGEYQVYYKRSTDGGSSWQNTGKITNTTAGSAYADIAVNSANVFVVYCTNSSENSDIFIKYKPF